MQRFSCVCIRMHLQVRRQRRLADGTPQRARCQRGLSLCLSLSLALAVVFLSHYMCVTHALSSALPRRSSRSSSDATSLGGRAHCTFSIQYTVPVSIRILLCASPICTVHITLSTARSTQVLQPDPLPGRHGRRGLHYAAGAAHSVPRGTRAENGIDQRD